MGMWDWLFGKRRSPPEVGPSAGPTLPKENPPVVSGISLPKEKPRVVADMGPDSPYIVVDTGDGSMTVMPRDMFEYLYDDVRLPDPAQRDIDELLSAVARVRVLAGGVFRGASVSREVLVDTSDPKAVAALRGCLQIDDVPPFSRCACFGGPALELFTGDMLAATIGLQHGNAIRWVRWKHDASLRDGARLTDWLTRRGVEPRLLDLLLHNGYDGSGLSPGGDGPLSPAEQRLRLAEFHRARGDVARALAECTLFDALRRSHERQGLLRALHRHRDPVLEVWRRRGWRRTSLSE
jgi:hypothetical protein